MATIERTWTKRFRQQPKRVTFVLLVLLRKGSRNVDPRHGKFEESEASGHCPFDDVCLFTDVGIDPHSARHLQCCKNSESPMP